MVNRPSTPEIITVNSESLQTLVRDLLPSQNGFGSELQATNVITPIIDLTATAEGSTLRSDLQTAIAFGSQTAFDSNNSTVAVANSPGFYRLIGVSAMKVAGTNKINSLQMTDGLSTKIVWAMNMTSGTSESYQTENVDLTFWLDVGITLNVVTDGSANHFQGSIRQIADSSGTFVSPSGFPL